MKNNSFRFIIILSLVLFALLSIFLNISDNYNKSHFIYPDATSYIKSASLLYNHNFTPHPYRPFGWPLIIGVPHLFYQNGASNETILQFAIVLNILFWLGSIYFFNKIITHYTNKKSALIFTLGFVLLISNILLVYQAMTETAFIFFLVLFAYHLQSFVLYKRNQNLVYASFFICYSAIIRPSNYYLSIISLIIFLFILRKEIKYIIPILLIFLFTVGAQVYSMQKHFGKPVISFIVKHTAYYYLFAKAEFAANPEKWANYDSFYVHRGQEINELARKDSALNNRLSTKPFLEEKYQENIAYNLHQNPGSVFHFLISDIRENCRTGSNLPNQVINYNQSSTFEVAKRATITITRYENMTLTLLFFLNWFGILLLIYRQRRFIINPRFGSILLFQLFCTYYLLTSGLSYWQGDRFNYVYYPLTLIVFSYILHQLKTYKSQPALVK